MVVTTALLALATGAAQPPAAIPLPDAEALSAVRELPDPFLMRDGSRAATREEWSRRRAEIRDLLLHYEYGHAPAPPDNLRVEETRTATLFGGAAIRKEVLLSCGPGNGVRFPLLLTIPQGQPGPMPAIVDGDVCWGERKQAELIARRGYILAEFDRTQLDGDNADRSDGVHPLYPECDWGTLAAWAWGYHRVVDYLVAQEFVDAGRIVATGHSRGGKTALLAGALDERIALTAPNDSGCGGAGPYRFQGEGSESLSAILKNFPYWFHPRLRDFIGREERLPFDQHFLMALVAPRALLVTNALGDLWANPQGTQQGYLAAREVYRFLGAEERIGNHYREGKHEHNDDDWRTLLDFADLVFLGKETETRFNGRDFPGAPKAFGWEAPSPARP